MSVSLVPPLADPYLAREQVRLDMLAHVEECRAAGRACRMNLHGMEGLGVSSLATRFYEDNKRLLGDPLIWLLGRTVDGDPTPPAELLSRLLRQLGVPENEQPVAEADLAIACRRLLAETACMIVIDDLATTEQVRQLSAIDAPRLVLVVTTPGKWRSLRVMGFRRAFTPEYLSQEDAKELFRIDVGGVEVPEPVVADLVDRCGGIPLLIKMLAAQIDGVPDAEALLTELRDARLDVLDLDFDRRVARFLDVSYAALGAEHTTVYRRLSLLPGKYFGAELAAAALDLPPSDSRLRLNFLVDHNLLVHDKKSDRYAFHPLVRADARARTGSEDDDPTRKGVVRRAVTWLAREALPRGRTGRWWIDSVSTLLTTWYGADPPTYSADDARAWFDLEWENVAAAVPLAEKYGIDDLVVPLCVALWKYLHSHHKLTAWFDTHEVGLRVAREPADLPAVMQLVSQQGAAYLEVGDTDAARERFAESLDLARDLAHAPGEQSALEWLGKTAVKAKRHDEAMARFQESWAVVERKRDEMAAGQPERMFALLRLQLARCRLAMAEFAAAKADAEAAVDWFDEQDETENQGKTRLALGSALLGTADAAGAAEVFETAVRLFERAGLRRLSADALVLLGTARVAAGLPHVEPFQRAMDYYRGIGSARADEIGKRLA